MLYEQLPNISDFKTFDVSHHRLSRCEKTSLLVDSGSKRKRMKLSDTGVWATTELDKTEWYYHEGAWNYPKKEGLNHLPGVPVNKKQLANVVLAPADAMAKCLEEVTKKTAVTMLSHSVENGAF
ncbi:hypothetical protein CDV31_002027 [Fusarium ambrosium]|uniref:Uncharacterized protein n=1 Tax=Fusarium ambrosium TaxID=131363 RepID=A0A428UXZ8_9HYPO|nr:hypothetical protein CDV31_002027 [Fusarium ambrosium]